MADSFIEDPGDYDTDVDPTSGEIIDGAGPAAPKPGGFPLLDRRPLVLLAKSHQQSNALPGLIRVAAKAVGSAAHVGLVVRLPKMTTDAARQYAQACPSRALIIADPDLYLAASSGGPDGSTPSAALARRHPWFVAAQPHSAAVNAPWIREVFDAQRASGANVLLSPTGWVDAANAAQQIRDAMRWVSAARTECSDEAMLVNLTMDASWLTMPALRNQLLTEMVESSETHWYLRFRWPVVDPRYGQLNSLGILQGYRDLATTAALEGKNLILPNSGLTGWLGTSLGARGFSTGPGWPEQAYAQQRQVMMPPGRPRPAPRLRYFERTILHTIDHSARLTLAARAGFTACTCRYCRSLQLSSPHPTHWDKESASLHHLLCVVKLTARLAGPNPRLEALRVVRTASRFASQQMGTVASLSGDNSPGHLHAWDQVLT